MGSYQGISGGGVLVPYGFNVCCHGKYLSSRHSWSGEDYIKFFQEGYDLILIGNFFAYPAFAQKYGEFVPSTNNYQLKASWQVALGNASGIEAFFGFVSLFPRETFFPAFVCSIC